MEQLGFPFVIRLTHFFNILFLSLLARSGIEILGGHPKLYWNDACTPGSEWLRFTRKTVPRTGSWTAEDEKEPYSPWIALPGRDNLGIGRYWHFAALTGWILVGLLYLALLCSSPQWRRLIPTSWSVFPGALDAAMSYLSFQVPQTSAVFNPLQQLAYASVILVIAPLQILTGVAMSPAVAGRFPWYTRIFGGRQAARSLHFIGLVALGAFTVHHTAIVVMHGLGGELAKIVLGVTDPVPGQARLALWLALAGVVFIAAIHVWATRASLRRRVAYSGSSSAWWTLFVGWFSAGSAPCNGTTRRASPRARVPTAARRATPSMWSWRGVGFRAGGSRLEGSWSSPWPSPSTSYATWPAPSR